ncbi:MAG: glyoxalase/bleomycin resistance protein/dioxygenase [Clostridiaceae bacterium]|jgi:lactoylglutathione lyase|nr:glyoxalase/bleomycin resistance protein/dioxygenase [Clostridiaceae bacterium]
MKIEHVAIWTKELEILKNFYTKYFHGTAGEKYINKKKLFESYFIKFDSGARLELMRIPSIENNHNGDDNTYVGLAHIAFSLGSIEEVNSITNVLKYEGYLVVSEPRYTGDGYYESCVLDPEGNRVEITA